uniref:SnoaL-like domain-containing protein n=1 Tax=Aegilops tauschii subsp. strangulata TaxID=200361 RepID=A0A453MMV4_AEGTS
MPSPLSACKHPNTMNSALTHISFQSPSFNLIQRPQSRHQQISIKWRKRQQCSAKPIRAIPGPNATGAYGGGNALPSSPLTDVIQEFYSSLNDKDITRLEKLISLDCVIEDTAYYKPLDVKNARTYFTRLIKVMGKNAKFAIDEVCQGVEPTVAVMWHLEWRGEIIPFAKGCSFFMCSANGSALLIRESSYLRRVTHETRKAGIGNT